jgi:hypothetical protein
MSVNDTIVSFRPDSDHRPEGDAHAEEGTIEFRRHAVAACWQARNYGHFYGQALGPPDGYVALPAYALRERLDEALASMAT